MSRVIGVRGFHARELQEVPVRWKGHVSVGAFFFLLSFFSHPESCLKRKFFEGKSIFFGVRREERGRGEEREVKK